MKTYVFIAMSIIGIGGSQQYLNNKSAYLKAEGWRVLIFSGMRGKVYISDLEEYKDRIIPALFYAPDCFGKKEVNRTVGAIVSAVGDGNSEVIIECNSMENAKWGEMAAEKLRCKCVVFNLQERHSFSESEREFLRFKLDRHELAGINKYSIGSMMGDSGIVAEDYMIIRAHCANASQDCVDDISPFLDENALTVCSIGRTSKPYFEKMIAELFRYFSAHRDRKYDFVLIGEADDAAKQKIMTLSQEHGGVNAVFAGARFPIPRAFFKNVDVFVSASASATVSYLERRPTIRIRPTDAKVCGIIGVNYFMKKNTPFDVIEDYSIAEALEDVLDKGVDIFYDENYISEWNSTMEKEFLRQLEIARFPAPTEYYDVSKVRVKQSRKQRLYHLFGKLAGGKGLQYMHMKLRGAAGE